MSVGILDILTAEAWRPNVGDTLTGALVHRDSRTTEYGTYPVLFMDTMEDGGKLVAVHAFHSTLLDGLKEFKPQRGQIFAITYAGMKESNKRKDKDGDPVEYHHYAVYDPQATVESAEIDWDEPGF